jgi:soluble lytic murein transglycosylase
MALTCINSIRASACVLALVNAWASAAATLATDADVLAAKDAAQKGNVKALEAARQRLAGHPLEAYPAYWLLVAQLERADAADVLAFLARYPDSPLSESLRREWLKVLGASGQWELFGAEHPKVVNDDLDLTCYAFQARLARGDAEVFGEARSLFLAGKESPASCEPVFAALSEAKRLEAAEIWERIRKLLGANALRDAKRANAMLPPRQAFNDRTLERAGADPGKFLSMEKSPILNRASKELAIYAVGRLARAKPDEAAERLALIAGRLGPEGARYAWGQVAWQAALAHHPKALEWYHETGDAALTDTQLAWKARAGLRAGDWKAVLAAIQALSSAEARESNWRYWRARALHELGSLDAAHALLQGVARETTFYGLLAAEDLGMATPPDWNGWRPAPADLERVRAMPGIERALALYRLDLDTEAFREWFWAVRGLEDRDLLAAAELARIAREPDRAINTAERTVHLHDFAQRYPTPHREALDNAARQFDVNEAWLYGIIRQESRFVAEARSRVGATGLMQLMPSTARWVARQLPLPAFQSAMLAQPEVNVQMGTYYFKRVLGELGDPVLATAAYNAGPGRARRWRDARPLDGAIYAETIPFNETRDYVKKVIANTWYYTHRLTGKAASMRALVGTVPGRANEPADASVASAIP